MRARNPASPEERGRFTPLFSHFLRGPRTLMRIVPFIFVSLAVHGAILSLPVSPSDQKREDFLPVRLVIEEKAQGLPKPQRSRPERSTGKRAPKAARGDHAEIEPPPLIEVQEQRAVAEVSAAAPLNPVSEVGETNQPAVSAKSREAPARSESASPSIDPEALERFRGSRGRDEEEESAALNGGDEKGPQVGFSGARYAHNPKPEYPERARREGWEGTVVLQVLVDPQGNSGSVEVMRSSGFKALDEAAVRTIRTWRFHPARSGETPVASWVKIPIIFRLAEDDRQTSIVNGR